MYKKISLEGFTVFLSFILFIFALANQCSANILINEVYPYPDSNVPADEEWVELINTEYQENSASALDLAGWTLWDTLSTPSVLFTFPAENIFLNTYFVIDIHNKLNNSGDGVVLKNELGEVIDQMSYSSSETARSWSRESSGIFNLTLPSKDSSNLIPTFQLTPTPTSTQTTSPLLKLSEIMACPDNESEWIELFNSSQVPLKPENWKIFDSQGEIGDLSAITIQALSFYTVEINQKLNNTGDQVFLKDENGAVIDNMSYENCQKAASFIWHENQWLETNSPTKNLPNTYTQIHSSTLPSPTVKPSAQPTPVSITPTIHSTGEVSHKKNMADNVLYLTPNILSNSLRGLEKFSTETAQFILAPPFHDHIIFNTTTTNKYRLISVIIGGLTLILAGMLLFFDSQKYDITETKNF